MNILHKYTLYVNCVTLYVRIIKREFTTNCIHPFEQSTPVDLRGIHNCKVKTYIIQGSP